MPGFTPGGLGPYTLDGVTETDRIERAESDVRDFCRWHIAPEIDEILAVDGSGSDTQVLPTRLLVSVTGVTLDGQPLTEGVHFRADRIGILTRIDGGRFTGHLRLAMRHGYSVTPPSVAGVIHELVLAGKGTVTGEVRAGPFAVIGARPGLTDTHRKTLSRYALEPGIC